jgi:hypothetical protein
MASVGMALFVGALSFAVWSFQRRRLCGSILSEACLLRFGPLGASSLRFGPLGASSLRFNPLGASSFAVRSVGGTVFAVRSF